MTTARIRALAIVGVLMVVALVLTLLTLDRDTQTHASYLSNCPSKSIPVVTSPLPPRNAITIKVWNGSTVPGRAQSVAEDLQHRGYKASTESGSKPTINDLVDIYYGPNTVAAAQVVRAEFLMTQQSYDNEMKFSINSKSNVIEIVIGKAFLQLGTRTEVNQAISALGTPNPPQGTCAKTG